MRYQEKLKDNQIQELKEFLETSESKKETNRIQSILMLDKEADIEFIKEITRFSRSQIFELRKKYLDRGMLIVFVEITDFSNIIRPPKLCDSY